MAGPIHLFDADDVRAAGFAQLIDAPRRRDIDRADDVFVAEGVRTIGQLLDARWPIASVLLTTSRADARPDLVDAAERSGATVYTAAQEVFDGIAGYHVHRGALALAGRPPSRSMAEVAAGAQLLLVVEGVNDHENIGSLFRNAAAFGVDGIVLDPTAADPLYRRSVRVSLGHVIRIPFARATAWPEGIGQIRAAGYTVVALTPDGDQPLGGLARTGPVAVMVGAEGDGLSGPARQAADVRVRIPMAAGADSLNVATAAAVALYRLSEDAHMGSRHRPPLVSGLDGGRFCDPM